TGHRDALRACVKATAREREPRERLTREFDRLLSAIPGDEAPALESGRSHDERALRRFVKEWNDTLAILQKLARRARQVTSPAWVDPKTTAFIILDRASEHWWHSNVRRQGEERAAELMMQYHERNKHAPEVAVEEMFALW